MMRIGPLGSLRAIDTYPEVSVPTQRATSERTMLSGRRIVQRAPLGMRSWTLDYQRVSPADLAYLTALASGVIPGPLYLYTEVAAQTNLLPVSLASPGAMGVSDLRQDGGYVVRGRVSALLGGTLTPQVAAYCGSVAGEWSPTVPLPLGSYRLSGWSTHSGTMITWRTVDAAGTPGLSGSIPASPTSGGYRGEATVTLEGANVGLQLRLPVEVSAGHAVGALRLTAGSTAQATDWLPGQGVPQVVVDDPEQTLQLVTASRIASDYSITLREVR